MISKSLVKHLNAYVQTEKLEQSFNPDKYVHLGSLLEENIRRMRNERRRLLLKNWWAYSFHLHMYINITFARDLR